MIIAATISATPPTVAVAGDAYLGFDLIGASSFVDFDGFNTAGLFSNKDEQREHTSGVSLKYGLRDHFTLGGMAITPEADLAWYNEYTDSSASFPGLPNPTLFYDTSIETGRLGVNLWTPFHVDENWRAEAGFGFGAMYRDVSTSDTFVQGQKDEYLPYGQLGFRFLRKLDDRSSLSLGTSYLFSESTNVPLTEATPSGAPAGVFEVETDHLEISIGYQLKLGQ